LFFFFFSSRRRHTRFSRDWSSDVCSSDLNRPVYSYKLSILHFWSLIFIYIWAGPHHLLYTSLPSWVQSLGVVFSIMLIAPSWGGMINGLLTLRGAWDK